MAEVTAEMLVAKFGVIFPDLGEQRRRTGHSPPRQRPPRRTESRRELLVTISRQRLKYLGSS